MSFVLENTDDGWELHSWAMRFIKDGEQCLVRRKGISTKWTSCRTSRCPIIKEGGRNEQVELMDTLTDLSICIPRGGSDQGISGQRRLFRNIIHGGHSAFRLPRRNGNKTQHGIHALRLLQRSTATTQPAIRNKANDSIVELCCSATATWMSTNVSSY